MFLAKLFALKREELASKSFILSLERRIVRRGFALLLRSNHGASHLHDTNFAREHAESVLVQALESCHEHAVSFLFADFSRAATQQRAELLHSIGRHWILCVVSARALQVACFSFFIRGDRVRVLQRLLLG